MTHTHTPWFEQLCKVTKHNLYSIIHSGVAEVESIRIAFPDIDGHESKPAISILAIVEKSQQTSNFRYFATYSFYVLT